MKNLTQLNRFMVVFFAMLTLSLTDVWGAKTVTLGPWSSKPITGAAQLTVADSLKDDAQKSWFVSLTGSDATKNPSMSVTNSYWQLGQNGNMVTATFSTKNVGGTITSIAVDCAAYQGKGEVNVTVGGNAFGTQAQATPTWSSSTGGVVTFSGSATGEIVVTMAATTGGRAIYLKSIAVTYETGGDEPSLSVSPASITFDKVEVGTTSVEGKAVTVTIENIDEVLTYMEMGANSPFSIDKESLTESGAITVTPLASTMATVGEYSDTLTITDAEELTKKVPVSIKVTDPAVIEKGFKLVTNAAVLRAGDELILGAAITSGETTNYFAAGAFGSNKFFSSTSATVAGDEITAPEAIIIKLGGNAGGWTFTTSEGLVGTKAAKALVLNDKDATTTWTISIDENKNAIITSTGEGLGAIQYNSGSPRFLNYATAQKPIQLYRRAKGTSTPTPVTEITAVNATDTVAVSDKLTLKYTIAPDTATDQRVEFAIVYGGEFISLNEGVVTGVAVGDAQVSVMALDSLNKGDKLVATYNIHVKEGVFNTCADVNAAAKDDAIKLNPVIVSYVNGANVYVQDASGSTLVYVYDSGLKAGDVVSGIKGTAAPYNGLPELKPSNKVADWTITAGEAPAFPDATTAPAADQVNKIFTYKGVSQLNGEFAEGTRSNLTGKFLGEDFNLYSNFKQAATFENDKIYDVVGAVGIINNTDVRVFFISATDVTPTRINEVVEKTAVKKMMVNGQMVIVRDGKMFNALGAEL